jgi:hypothetical protein
LRRHLQLPLASDFGEVAQAIREAERSLQDLSKVRTQLGNRLHLQLSDTYTAAYEEYFGKLKSPLALRFFRRFPLPQDLVGHNVEMLASLLLDLAGGKVGPHKGGNRLIAMRSKAQAILETSGAMRASPRTLALELKAELIRQLCDELLANHDRIIRLERMLREQLLPATKQTITTITGISTILAATIIGETGSITRFARLQRSPSTMAPHRLATAPAVAIVTKHGAIAIIASSALSIWPHGQRFCMIRLRKPIIKAARAEASVMSRRSSGSHDGCLTWSMPCSNQARPTIVRSSSMPSNGAGSRRHTRHAATRNKALSTPDQGNPTRRSRSSK